MRTVGDLRAHATRALLDGDTHAALQAFASLVTLQPQDLDARLRVADSLLALGEVQRAAVVYTVLARHAANGGYPLHALVALKILTTLDPQLGSLMNGVAELYAVTSPRLGRSARLAPGNDAAELPSGFVLGKPPALEQLVPNAERIASDLSRIGAYPEKLSPLPIFSELPVDGFQSVLSALKLVRVRPGEAVIRQGDAHAFSFFVLARGRVRVSRVEAGGTTRELARLEDGAIFGEMALVAAAPRSATVTAETDCDLLEFDRDALLAAATDVVALAAALDRFARQRLLTNLVASAPLFAPLDRKQRLDLVRRFAAYDIAPGTDIVREGDAGRGLYVLLQGEADVWKVEGDEKVLLATLEPGDVFGEISLIRNTPTTASVTAATPTTVLFLAKEIFDRLIAAVPAIREYAEKLSDTRLADTSEILGGDSLIEAAPDLDE